MTENLFGDEVAGDARPHYKQTSDNYARMYGCDARTIRRYRAKGYPLDNPAAMAEIFAAQKKRPAGVQNLVATGSLDSEGYVDAGDDALAGEATTGDMATAAARFNVAKLEKVLLECKRLAFRLEVEKGQYTKNSEIKERLAALLSETKSALRKALENELPSMCEGLPAANIQIKMREALDSVLGDLTRGAEQIAAVEPHTLDDEPDDRTSDGSGDDARLSPGAD